MAAPSDAVRAAAAAIANARGARRGALPISNVLDVIRGTKSYDEIMEDAEAALSASEAVAASKAPDRPAGLLVVPDWLDRLSLQQQSVLMLATRGPDGVRKYHPAKVVHCAYRATVLRAAYRGRFLHWGETADTFMSLDVIADRVKWADTVKVFFQHVDELPHHYVAHLAHGAQIIGYRHPDQRFRDTWGMFYRRWCEDLHVAAETHEQMNARLGDWGAAAPRLAALGVDFPLPKSTEGSDHGG